MNARLSHVGISVRNLQESIKFYRQCLSMEVLVLEEFSGQKYNAILGLKGTSGRVALLRTDKLELELFEFTNPRPMELLPCDERPVCNYGITHFCIEVSNIESVYEGMKARGVVFHCPPISFTETVKATYGRDPDGNVFELLEQM